MLFRRPVHEVAQWPAAEVELLEAFMAREPAPEQRTEIAVARLCEMFAAVHHDPKSGPRRTLTDFLPYLEVWKPEATVERYSDVDHEVLAALGMKGK